MKQNYALLLELDFFLNFTWYTYIYGCRYIEFGDYLMSPNGMP